MNTSVTIIVVTHDRPHLLAQTLKALAAQSFRAVQVIVVDNASAAETQQILTQHDDITVLRLEQNIGGAGGFARGVETALQTQADWIWLLDDDAVPYPDALEQLVTQIPHMGEKAGAVCSAVSEFGRVALQHRRYFEPHTLRELPVTSGEYQRSLVKVDTGSFVGFLLCAVAAREVGLPDAGFFLAYDDTEYSLRLGEAGWTLWLAPASVIDHRRKTESRLRYGPFSMRHYYNLRNRLAVFRRYGRASSWRLWIPIAQFAALAVKDLRIASLKLWWRSVCDSRHMVVGGSGK